MALKPQRWYPVVCRCVFVTLADPDDHFTSVHKHQESERKCPDHAHLSGQAHYDAVLMDDRRKEFTWEFIKQIVPALALPTVNRDDHYVWDFSDGVRVLEIALRGVSLTPTQRQQVMALIDLQFGSGQVRLI